MKVSSTVLKTSSYGQPYGLSLTALKKIPIVMLSGKNGVFERARGRLVGAKHYMTKPFTKDDLLNAIKVYVMDAKTAA